jgi:hypothetical protein
LDEYLGIYMRLMKADPTFIFRVAEAASEAAEFVISFSKRGLADTS